MTGQAASRTILSISSSACSELSPSPTRATSGRSRAVTSPTWSASISRAITSCPRSITIAATGARRSLRSLAIRTRRCSASRELIFTSESKPPRRHGSDQLSRSAPRFSRTRRLPHRVEEQFVDKCLGGEREDGRSYEGRPGGEGVGGGKAHEGCEEEPDALGLGLREAHDGCEGEHGE